MSALLVSCPVVLSINRLQFLEDGEKLAKPKSKAATFRAKRLGKGGHERGDSASSCEEYDEEPRHEDIIESRSTPSLDSASVASSISSGIGDAGFLYKRLKVLK